MKLLKVKVQCPACTAFVTARRRADVFKVAEHEDETGNSCGPYRLDVQMLGVPGRLKREDRLKREKLSRKNVVQRGLEAAEQEWGEKLVGEKKQVARERRLFLRGLLEAAYDRGLREGKDDSIGVVVRRKKRKQ